KFQPPVSPLRCRQLPSHRLELPFHLNEANPFSPPGHTYEKTSKMPLNDPSPIVPRPPAAVVHDPAIRVPCCSKGTRPASEDHDPLMGWATVARGRPRVRPATTARMRKNKRPCRAEGVTTATPRLAAAFVAAEVDSRIGLPVQREIGSAEV